MFPIQPNLPDNHDFNGEVAWRCPSNIALVKYWGKRPVQLPANASISFTLDKAHTITSVQYSPRKNATSWVRFTFEDQEHDAFAQRIIKYFSSIKKDIPWIEQLSFDIKSENSFPHSSGIASSASSMGALALCLCDIEKKLFNNEKDFLKKASHLSRLGSGSASRSIYPSIATWGLSSDIDKSSDFFAIPVTDFHDVFSTFHDDILIVSDREKSVSSSAGHALMETNIFADNRYTQAGIHMTKILSAIKTGDLETFGKIVEDEALTLHALMMCSDPSYILMEPHTIEVIKRIRAFRDQTSIPIFFTLDAGPNVHILYPDSVSDKATDFINAQLLPLAHKGRIIRDKVGSGPVKL